MLPAKRGPWPSGSCPEKTCAPSAWNAIDVGLGQGPHRIAGRDHAANEIFEFSGRTVVGHQPDADAEPAFDDRPAWLRLIRQFGQVEVVFLPQPVQPVGHRLPTGVRIVVCVQHDTEDCAPGRVDFHFDGIEQRLSLPSFSTIQKFCANSLRSLRCITTCLSSGPSTSSTRGCESDSCIELPDFDSLFGSYLQSALGVADGAQPVIFLFEAYQHAFDVYIFCSRLGEAPDAVPAVRRGEDLHVVLVGRL